MKQFTAIIIGAGGRGRTYARKMADLPQKFKLVGVAEPVNDLREDMKNKYNISSDYTFNSWEDILSVPKFADIAVIATMDKMHTEPAIKAMELGYDLLLEKPIAPTPEECALIMKTAKKLGRKVMVCHVLRYTPFFRSIKQYIEEGRLGNIISIEHMEAVGNRHQSHSFVRGNWGNSERSSFMLLQKCCHDLDIIQWLVGKECKQIQSFGDRSYFRKENAPNGSPERCIEGCPVGETCPYNAVKLYLDDKSNGWFRAAATSKMNFTDEDVIESLKTTQYGKCVFKCDNDVVDHQTVNMQFEGGITASMTMCAFTKGGRRIRIMGTKGDLIADMNKPPEKAMEFYNFATNEIEYLPFNCDVTGDSIVGGHGGGDAGIVFDLYSYLNNEISSEKVSEIVVSCKNHMLSFAGEEARLSSDVINMEEYNKKYMD